MLKRFGWPGLLIVVMALSLGWVMREARFDDPFITYRYAEHFGSRQGFWFNANSPGALLTTSPAYALLLGTLHALGADVPRSSQLISIGAIAAGGLLLQRMVNGFAGVAYVLMPLLWLTLGFETPLFLAVGMAALACVQRPMLSGALAGLALGLRGDGALVLALLVVDQLLRGGRGEACLAPTAARFAGGFFSAIKCLMAAIATYAPLALWLTIQFGSPIPSTLATKSAQAMGGLTGFYPDTSYVHAFWLLLQSTLMTNPLIGLNLALIAFGVWLVCRGRTTDDARIGGKMSRQHQLLLAWPIVHFASYSLIGVAPYVWYFAPMLPGAAAAIGLAVNAFTYRAGGGIRAQERVLLCWLLMLLIPALSLWRIVQIWQGQQAPPAPSELASKALPETKVFVYERVGRWLAVNTPASSTLGMTELGVMGYYADRHAIDFLGLTSPQDRDAIRHGDFQQSLLREQPDFVALTAINALYDRDPQNEDWFKLTYAPLQAFSDPRFWGSPVTVYQRRLSRPAALISLDNHTHALGAGWELLSIEADSRVITPGKPVLLRLQLRAGARVGSRNLRVQPVLIAGSDGLPAQSVKINTSLWQPGETGWVLLAIAPQPVLATGGYVVSLHWEPDGHATRAGFLKVQAPTIVAPALTANFENGIGLAPMGIIDACLERPLRIALHWRGAETQGRNFTAFLHVRDGGQLLVQTDGPPLDGRYPTSLWSAGEGIYDPRELPPISLPGEYALIAGLYLPPDNTRLPVLAGPFAQGPDTMRVGTLRVRRCE